MLIKSASASRYFPWQSRHDECNQVDNIDEYSLMRQNMTMVKQKAYGIQAEKDSLKMLSEIRWWFHYYAGMHCHISQFSYEVTFCDVIWFNHIS